MFVGNGARGGKERKQLAMAVVPSAFLLYLIQTVVVRWLVKPTAKVPIAVVLPAPPSSISSAASSAIVPMTFKGASESSVTYSSILASMDFSPQE